MTINNKNSQGWIVVWRKITKSEIWEQEPWRLKAWLYLIIKAEHREKEDFSRKLKRGEVYINRLEDFCNEISWKKGCVIVKPSVNAMKKFLQALRKYGKVATKRTTRGIIVSILNYRKHQDIGTIVDTKKKPLVDTIADTKSAPTGSPDRQQYKPLNNNTSERSNISFKKKDYSHVLEAYQRLRGIKLQGQEFRPIEQAIKGMFMSDRTPEQIICCMEALNKHDFFKDKWDINLIKKKMPEFVAGKLTKDDSWQYAK